MKNTLIFSDLDGTLLNHHDYSFTTALPALEKIKRMQIPLILNSSKTLDEMIDLRTKLDNIHPFIIENGAAVIIPKGYFPGFNDEFNERLLGTGRDEFLSIIHELRGKHHFLFKGFADFSIAELITETGLSPEQAEKSQHRIGTEPILWLGDSQSLDDFRKHIHKHQLKLIKGGRFLHVMGQTDKAQAMDWLTDQYRKHRQQEFTRIALGDNFNDKTMLEKADIAVVIRTINGDHLKIEKPDNSVIYTTNPAPLGWQEAMEQIFNHDTNRTSI